MPQFLEDVTTSPKFYGNQVSIMYHNIQGLFSHRKDLETNLDFKDADYICITETWLTSASDSVSFNDFEFTHIPRSLAFVANDPLFASLKEMNHGGVGFFS